MTAPGHGRRVLLVDDAPEVRMLLQVLLEQGGFVVTEAIDGPHGVASAIEQLPDVVVLDVQLPGLDGPDVLRALRADPATAQLPVVFLTGSAASADDALLALDARGVLHKPFSAATVADDLAALL